MAGRVIRILPKQSFDFKNLQLGTTQSTPLAERVDVSQYKLATVGVRVFTGNMSAGTEVRISAISSGYTTEEPGRRFADAFQGRELAIICILPGMVETWTAEQLLPGRMGSLVDIWLSGIQGLTQPSNFDLSIGVDLILKE